MKVFNLTGPVPGVYESLKRELERSGLPVVVFGNSDVAAVMSPEMEKAGIRVQAVTVGDDYWKPGCSLMGLPVLPFSAVRRQYARFNVVGCFHPLYAGVVGQLADSGVVETLYLPYFDILNFFTFDRAFLEANAPGFAELKASLSDPLSIETLDRYLSAKQSCDTTVLAPAVVGDQYFPRDLVTLSAEEVFVDCGAFVGDTISDFLARANGRYGGILALEPSRLCFEKLASRTAGLANVRLVHGGCWDSKCMLPFREAPGGLSSVADGGVSTVPFDTLDGILGGGPCTFIKADVEGTEMRVLRGAEGTIKAYHPVLAFSVYHKADDLLTIPKYIRALNPEYRLALRMHHCFSDLVLYAIPE